MLLLLCFVLRAARGPCHNYWLPQIQIQIQMFGNTAKLTTLTHSPGQLSVCVYTRFLSGRTERHQPNLKANSGEILLLQRAADLRLALVALSHFGTSTCHLPLATFHLSPLLSLGFRWQLPCGECAAALLVAFHNCKPANLIFLQIE